MKDIKKKFLVRFLNILGFKEESNLLENDLFWVKDCSTSATLKTIKGCIGDFSTVVDIGASDGRWTADLLNIYPNVKGLLIEANPFHEDSLKKFTQKNKNTIYELCAAGDYNGVIFFDNSDPFGGVASYDKNEGYIQTPVCRPDDLVAKHALKGDYLLKLDTHGFETAILKGSKNILKNSALVVIETYNFQLRDGSLKFWEMCKHMNDLGFSPVGISEIMYRKYDNALWQFDLMFIPKTSKTFEYCCYD